MHTMAKITASAPASPAHAYQATLISHDSSGTNRASPNTSPQPNDPRRLRPVSATTSSPGPRNASGHTSSGGDAANTASPPASRQQQRPPRPEPPERARLARPGAGGRRGLR